MKNKLMLLSVLLLTLAGCATTELTARLYDANEYNYAVNIAVNATHAVARCETRNAEYDVYLQKINSDSFTLLEYVSNKTDTKQALPAATQIREISLDFLNNKMYNNRYCQHKLSNIQGAARMFARGVGYTDRFNICKGNVLERFTAFELSYTQNMISREEFANLSQDLLKMQKIDTAGCTLEDRVKLEQAINIIQTAVKFLL